MRKKSFFYCIILFFIILNNCKKDGTPSLTGNWSSVINYTDSIDHIIILKDSLGNMTFRRNHTVCEKSIRNNMELKQSNSKLSGTFAVDSSIVHFISSSYIKDGNIILEWVGPVNKVNYALKGELNSDFNSITGSFYYNNINKGTWVANKK